MTKGEPHPLTGHLPPKRAPHWGRAFAHWPNGAPHTGHLPPFGRPTGGYGHRLPHWPPTGHLLAIRGAPDWPPDGGAFARPSPDWSKGREGEPMATRELQPPTSRPPDGVGFFACKGCLCDVARVSDPPFGDPLALPYTYTI